MGRTPPARPPDTLMDAALRCREAAPGAFFPSDGVGVDRARRVCADCEVRSGLPEYAVEFRIDHGVWGGCSERERRRILRQRRLTAPRESPCGPVHSHGQQRQHPHRHGQRRQRPRRLGSGRPWRARWGCSRRRSRRGRRASPGRGSVRDAGDRQPVGAEHDGVRRRRRVRTHLDAAELLGRPGGHRVPVDAARLLEERQGEEAVAVVQLDGAVGLAVPAEEAVAAADDVRGPIGVRELGQRRGLVRLRPGGAGSVPAADATSSSKRTSRTSPPWASRTSSRSSVPVVVSTKKRARIVPVVGSLASTTDVGCPATAGPGSARRVQLVSRLGGGAEGTSGPSTSDQLPGAPTQRRPSSDRTCC